MARSLLKEVLTHLPHNHKGDPMKKNIANLLTLVFLSGLLLLTGCTPEKTVKTAETQTEDRSWMFHDIVDADFVKAHINVPMPGNVMLIDSRPYKTKFIQGHIPGAVSIPFSEFDQKINLLPQDKNALLIFYCEGEACKLSHSSAKKAESLGYKKVKVYAKGYPEWEKLYGGSADAATAKSGEIEGAIDLDRFTAIITDNPGSIMLVDVRDADEFKKGSFKTAVNIPVENLDKKINDLADNKPVVFVCSTGARSGEAFYMVKDLRKNLKEVYYVDAGITFKGDGKYEIKKPEKR
jgi:rhodanese-related sulfurtransferase